MSAVAAPAELDAQFLIRVLREGPNSEFWPKDFKWDFWDHRSCGLGLLSRLYPVIRFEGEYLRSNQAATLLGIDENAACLAFIMCGDDDPSPLDVADALEAALARAVPDAADGVG